MSGKRESRNQALQEAFRKSAGQIDAAAESEFIKDLVSTITEPLKKIPEPVFREIFLPYFTGEKKADKNNEAIANWIGLIGSATSPAEVVSVTGDVLFEVPPMVDSSLVNTNGGEKDGFTFSTIFQEYEDQNKVHPALGQRVLVEELAQRGADTLPDDKPRKYSWAPILKHYKLIDEKTGVPVAKQLPGDEDLDFGD